MDIGNIFRIQVKRSTFVKFQLKIYDILFECYKKTDFFFGGKVLFKKKEIEKKFEFYGKN